MIEAELPDGTVLEFPDGTSPDVVQRVVKQRLGVAAPAPAPSRLDMLKKEFVNSVPVQAALGAVRGAGSIGATLLAPRDALQNLIAEQAGAPQLKVGDRREAMTGALQQLGANPESIAFQGGKLGTEIAGTAGVGNVLGAGAQAAGAAQPLVQALRTGGLSVGGATGAGAQAARVLGGAATGGAAAGLVNPEDAATGAVVGGALPVVTQGAAAAGRAIGERLRPKPDSVTRAALDAGAPLSIADISENQFIKGARSFLGDVPIIGRPADKASAAKQEWLNRQVGKTFGAEHDKLTLEVMDSAKKRLGSEFNRIWGNNALTLDPQFIDDISRIQNEAATKLNPEQAAQVQRQMQTLLQRVQDGKIAGDFANNWQSELRMIADGEKGLHQKLLSDLRKATLSAFSRGLTPEDAAALALNKQQYRAFKTVEPLLAKGEVGVAGREAGDVPAALLPNAVFQQYGTGGGATPLGQAAQMGSKFVADRVAQTGGSPRAMIQNSALGGAFAFGSLTNPMTLLTAPAGYGLSSALNSPAAARALMGQGQVSPQLIQALRGAQLAAPVLSAQ